MSTQPQSRIVKAFTSKKIVLTIQVGAVRYKAFQIVFPLDGSLFVTFPYFRHRTGILAAATIPANGQISSQVDLRVGGKIASHDVKYSHHSDGRAHFSQDGKVFTVVKRQSIALEKYQGHIFSVLIQGVEGFDQADDAKDTGYTPKRTSLTFGFATPPDAVKFVGRWYDISRLPLGEQQQSTVGPNFNLINPSGQQLPGSSVRKSTRQCARSMHFLPANSPARSRTGVSNFLRRFRRPRDHGRHGARRRVPGVYISRVQRRRLEENHRHYRQVKHDRTARQIPDGKLHGDSASK